MNEDKNAKMMKVLQQEIATLRQLLAQKDEVADEGKVCAVAHGELYIPSLVLDNWHG